ncbi:uncharacterized protein CPUR_02997 [Claviceps purpurea 20.1]|uniref:F-box domain-containing protein n=1 Tax=Claviceps purpurea (strain 20.1) TaxID=1111077 RepID=M1WD64_CLAP2|nr:uncharacterized protein CPUR_02997 [Claviceps purpurea 20.1]
MAAPVESHRQSPLCLPPELVTDIFSYLNTGEMLISLSVCKEWKNTLTRFVHGPLWRNLEVPNNSGRGWPGPSFEVVENMLSWAGDGGANRIVMGRREMARETLTLLLNASPNLEHLEYTLQEEDFLLPSNEHRWKRLKYVAIHESERAFLFNLPDVPGGFPRTFLQNAASSLEHLALDGIPIHWHRLHSSGLEPKAPFLPKLKTLRMEESSTTGLALPLFNLSDAFPGLEQLFLSQYAGTLFLGPMPSSRRREDVWPHLKVLLYEVYLEPERHSRDISILPFKYLTCPSRGNSLQHIRLDFGDPSWSCMFRDLRSQLPTSDVTQVSEFQSLRSFRSCGLPMSPVGARNLVSHAIQAGQLSSFDIVFPPTSPDHHESINHLQGYEWLRGAPSIVTLGCYHFSFPSYPKDNEDLCLPQFLATFPNLQTLSIESNAYRLPSFTHLMKEILKLTHLKTIYAYHYNDHARVRFLRQAAEERGVELITEERPQQWPMPLSS